MVSIIPSVAYPVPLPFMVLIYVWTSCRWASLKVEGRVVDITLTIALARGTNVTKTLQVDDVALQEFGVAKEDLEKTLVHRDADGKMLLDYSLILPDAAPCQVQVREIYVGDKLIPVFLSLREELESKFYSFKMVNGSMWNVNRLNFAHANINDFNNDSTLQPLDVSLDWSIQDAYSGMMNITLMSAILDTDIKLNNDTLLHEHADGPLPTGNTIYLVPFNGIYLWVINPYTHTVVFRQYFNTEEYYSDQELIETIASLKDGSIAVITTYYDSTIRLEEPSIEFLTSMGSFAAKHIRFRDCWAWAWIVGQNTTLGEALVTNPQGVNSVPMPLQLDVSFFTPDPSDRMCSSWPTEKLWIKRRHFCDSYDGYRDLCSCEDPYQHPDSLPKLDTWREDIGIVILTGSRTRYLYRHLRFALFKIIGILEVDKVIVLEDDLIISPDFYSYMQQTSIILDKDPTVYGVSAYNHFSYDHTARDPSRLLRVHSLPSYGWMVKRTFLEEILPMWLPAFVMNDWDYWMGSELVRRGREVVIPEISRSAHGGMHGIHTSNFLLKKRYSSRPLCQDPNAIVNLTTVNRIGTEKEIKDLLDRAQPLNVTNPFTYSFPNASGEVGLIFVRCKDEEDVESFKVLAAGLKVWSLDNRDHHYGLWRLPHYKATLMIVGVPFSKYSNYYKIEHTIFKARRDTWEKMMSDFNEEQYDFTAHFPGDEARILNVSPHDFLSQQQLNSSPHHQHLQKDSSRIENYERRIEEKMLNWKSSIKNSIDKTNKK